MESKRDFLDSGENPNSEVSSKDLLDHSRLLDSGEAKIQALKSVREAFVINSQPIEGGCVKVTNVHGILSDVVTEIVRRAVRETGAYP